MTDKQRTKLLSEELKKFFPQYNNNDMFNQTNGQASRKVTKPNETEKDFNL